MRYILENHGTGWSDIFLTLSKDEIDKLISSLKMLKNDEIGHFHLVTTDFNNDSGISDIEISIKDSKDADNMIVR